MPKSNHIKLYLKETTIDFQKLLIKSAVSDGFDSEHRTP